MTVSFDIKPRTLNGLLLSVYGKRAMFALQLINGSINFTVNSGDEPITALFNPEGNNITFCDGEWHTVTAIKSKYIIQLTVDSWYSHPTVGVPSASSTDTTRPLFLGGHPSLKRARGLTVRTPFIGCMRNLRIKNITEPIYNTMIGTIGTDTGPVHVGVCPLY